MQILTCKHWNRELISLKVIHILSDSTVLQYLRTLLVKCVVNVKCGTCFQLSVKCLVLWDGRDVC